jgi:hypothetical protein
VDHITFIVYGGPDGWGSLLWPHKSILGDGAIIDGKQVRTYNLLLQGQFYVGILAHEMFHSLGAPDLYRHYGYKFPVGPWDLMDRDLNPPQHMSCYMKFRYGGWIANIPEITTSGVYTLNPLTSPVQNCYKIASPYSNSEYFVLEYRRTASSIFEGSLPGSGLVVYRINTDKDGQGNALGPPDEVYVYRPDGTTDADGWVGEAAFSSNVGRTAFNASTNPNSFLSLGGPGGLDISNIGASNGSISFQVNILSDFPEIDVTGNGFSIPSEDCTPSYMDYTDFEIVDVDGGFRENLFWIGNSGNTDLVLSSSPKVEIGETNSPGDFTVTTQPDSPVAVGDETLFRVGFDPSTVGLIYGWRFHLWALKCPLWVGP